jgi:hypothetical protein
MNILTTAFKYPSIFHSKLADYFEEIGHTPVLGTEL